MSKSTYDEKVNQDVARSTPARDELPKLLIVDDVRSVRVTISAILADVPVEIIEASCGEEALELAAKHRFFMILMDVLMPEMDGFETVRRLRANDPDLDAQIIYVTGHFIEEMDQKRGYDSGAADYILKPPNPVILKAKVALFMKLWVQKEEIILAKNAIEDLHAELGRKREALQRSNKELSEFAHVAAHDMKAPLGHISAFTGFVIKDPDSQLSERSKEDLSRVRQSIDRMTDLIASLLIFADVDVQAPQHQGVELDHVLADVCQDLDQVIKLTSAKVEIKSLPQVHGDEVQLRQLFQNLLANALKFVPGDRNPKLSIKASMDDTRAEFCRVSVSDNGIGFDQNQAESIFKPFKRLVGREQFEGSGVGLGTVMKIVKRHGGSITATGEAGAGATFTVVLPLQLSQPIAD